MLDRPLAVLRQIEQRSLVCPLTRRKFLVETEMSSAGARRLIAAFLFNLVPFPSNRALRTLWAALTLVLAPLEMVLRRRADARLRARTTSLAVKP